ncbi:hypothetical protein DPEC_G00007340 [Dallia pectoralis]|uniref:Uncharacterized protein n=1 Tax=Dallia pectoralis TaxID=75939 RepID=A0ACC2HKB7_DALPE|nr:hypothetical protein DPEC_G00007340 [Dallia pectoralis]
MACDVHFRLQPAILHLLQYLYESCTYLPLNSSLESRTIAALFLSQCLQIFELQASSFPTEKSRVAYMITMMNVQALEWAMPIWDQQLPVFFNAPLSGREAARLL